MADMVNHPPHYTQGKIEVLDFILDQKLGYLEGQVIKYLCRAPHKGTQAMDYHKAQFYLNKLVEMHEIKRPGIVQEWPSTYTYRGPATPLYPEAKEGEFNK
jgi:hypothetical protein